LQESRDLVEPGGDHEVGEVAHPLLALELPPLLRQPPPALLQEDGVRHHGGRRVRRDHQRLRVVQLPGVPGEGGGWRRARERGSCKAMRRKKYSEGCMNSCLPGYPKRGGSRGPLRNDSGMGRHFTRVPRTMTTTEDERSRRGLWVRFMFSPANKYTQKFHRKQRSLC